MKVTSPVGDFPYTVERLAWRDGTFVVDGRMGTWPARVEIAPRDLGHIARLARAPIMAAGGLAVLALLLFRRLG